MPQTLSKLPEHVRVGFKAYYYSPSLARVSVIEVDSSPTSTGEIQFHDAKLPDFDEGAVDYFNEAYGVDDYRPATAAEVAKRVASEDDDDGEPTEVEFESYREG